jgi:predicted HTH domain antitoxin
MSNVKIELEIPEEILMNLKQSTEEFKNELKLTMAIELYKKKRLSLGKAAVLGGFTKIGFIDVLNFRGEPVFNYTDDEIETEIQNIKKLSINEDCNGESNL